jgi:hypothetical protein
MISENIITALVNSLLENVFLLLRVGIGSFISYLDIIFMNSSFSQCFIVTTTSISHFYFNLYLC